MTTRFATRIGLSSEPGHAGAPSDIVRFHEPSVGAQVRTKGSLYLLAQISGADVELSAAAAEAVAAVELDYYYDLTGGVHVALNRAVSAANRRIYQQRRRLGIPERSRIGLVAVVIHGREAHVVRVGAPTALLGRGGGMYELPPPQTSAEDDPRVPRRRVALSLGESIEIEPYRWEGEVAAGDRVALVSRQLARVVGVDELKAAMLGMPPAQLAEHLRTLLVSRGASGSAGILALEIVERPQTESPAGLQPIAPAEPFAVWPDRSPVPLADTIGRELQRSRGAAAATRARVGRAARGFASLLAAFVPRRPAELPRGIHRTSVLRDGRRRRLGVAGMLGVAALVAVGAMVAALPAALPTDAIPRALVARESISEAASLLRLVDERVAGADLVDREPDAAADALAGAHAALERALLGGVPAAGLGPLGARLENALDRLHRVTRIALPDVVVDLAATLDDLDPLDMVAASDGSLWVLETGRGRVLRIDPAAGTATVVYRAGQALPSGALPGDPWLIATAATDVVIVDRDRAAWRIDLAELVPHPMSLNGLEGVSAGTTLISALQHRPPLEIFNLYLVDGASGRMSRWTPPPVIPVEYPAPPEEYLSKIPDLDPRLARDLRVDVNGWLLHADTVTRIDFGTPRGQDEYSLDPPSDAEVRPALDYRLIDGATVGDRELLYVYDAGSARLLAFQRVDGAFVRQWMAPSQGPQSGLLTDIRGLSVASVADGPPVAYLLTPDGVVRLVLE